MPSFGRRRSRASIPASAEWPYRAGRFRSLGDGDIDFGAIFSSLSVYGYDSWAVLEWECAIKNRDDGAKEGAAFIARHLIKVNETTSKISSSSAPIAPRSGDRLG